MPLTTIVRFAPTGNVIVIDGPWSDLSHWQDPLETRIDLLSEAKLGVAKPKAITLNTLAIAIATLFPRSGIEVTGSTLAVGIVREVALHLGGCVDGLARDSIEVSVHVVGLTPISPIP
jgi:hypothetical protein